MSREILFRGFHPCDGLDTMFDEGGEQSGTMKKTMICCRHVYSRWTRLFLSAIQTTNIYRFMSKKQAKRGLSWRLYRWNTENRAFMLESIVRVLRN